MVATSCLHPLLHFGEAQRLVGNFPANHYLSENQHCIQFNFTTSYAAQEETVTVLKLSQP